MRKDKAGAFRCIPSFSVSFIPLYRTVCLLCRGYREKQDKIALGLLPPPEPKMKMSNFMQVCVFERVSFFCHNSVAFTWGKPIAAAV